MAHNDIVQYYEDGTVLDHMMKANVEKKIKRFVTEREDITSVRISTHIENAKSHVHTYRVRVVVHQASEHIAAEKKGKKLSAVVSSTLHTLERQLRSKRAKQRESWKRNHLRSNLL